MTCAVFEAHVREMERIKAIKAISLADVMMLPHVSNYARREWFGRLTKLLMPRFATNEILTFNGRKVGVRQLKRVLGSIAKKNKAEEVA